MAIGPSKGGRDIPEVNEIDQSEGRIRIEEFRRQRLRGDFAFEFDLLHLPRRGEEKRFQGVLLGTWNIQGPLSRMALWPEGRPDQFDVGLIIQSGRNATVHTVKSGEAASKLDLSELTNPLLDDFIYSAFDVLMPFVYWDDFVYEGSKRVRSRSAHMFLMYPPKDFQEKYPDVHSVRLKLDAHYNALLGAEVLNHDEKVVRVFNVMSFDKADDQYVVKTIDLIDKKTKDKTRFKVRRVSLNLRLAPKYFNPELLKAEAPDLSPFQFQRL